MPRLDATERWITLTLIRQLALGAPVGVSGLATAAELSEAQVADTLDRLPGVFRDEQQRVVGFMGLTVVEIGQHRIHLDGRPLSAWCAWDTLFLPELLGEDATIESTSTQGGMVTLTVTPERVERVEPNDACMSVPVPDAAAVQKDVVAAFCHFVHFFPSR